MEDIFMNECIFCKICGGELESHTIFDSNEFKVILDKFPAAKGHALIIPKEHFDDIYGMDSETAGKLFALATVVARSMKKVLGCGGMNILQNNGEVAGQTVNHFHMHLIPRYKNDGFTLPWETKSYSDDELAKLSEMISKGI